MYLLKNKTILLFYLFIVLYALLFLVNPQLGPNDDYVFLRTLQSGKPLIYASDNFPYYDWKGLGRFQPLVSMEYNIIGLFSKSPKPFWYYFIHAIEFVLFAVVFTKLLSKITLNKFIVYGSSVLLFLLPGFTFSWFRLQLPERNVLFLFAAFLFCLFAYQKEKRVSYLILAGLIANIAIYYKEIASIIIGVFAFAHLIFSRKTQDKKIKNLNYFLILSSITYLFVYYFYIYKHAAAFFLFKKENLIYGSALVYLKNIFNYGFFSDPILVLLLFPLMFLRIYEIFIKHKEPKPLYDSMLFASSTYVFIYFVLKLYNPYYLLPAYAFAIPALIYFFTQEKLKKPIWKIVIFITCFLLIANSIPAGIHFLTWHKYVPVNFNKTLDFLTKEINLKSQEKPANVFLDNINLAAGRGLYFIFGDFLLFKGLNPEQFDLKSNVATNKPEPIFSKIQMPFTVFNKDTISEIKSGDYLIIVPQGPRNITSDYIESLKNNYTLVFRTKSKFEFPQINLKTLIKYILSKKITAEQKAGGIMLSENLWDYSDYYVFVKK